MRVLIRTLTLALLVFLVTAIPMVIWHRRLQNETALTRATALAHWLAAEAASKIGPGGRGLPDVGAGVLKEPGVVAYLVLSPRGEVWAPASRAQREGVAKLPGIGVAPSEILRLRAAWNGDLVEVALPIAVGDDPRGAIAALTFRPASAPGQTSAEFLVGPLLLAALVLGWVAALGLRRTTLATLAAFNEEIDLLLSGQVAAVEDPLRTKPTKELTEVINHLASRVRAEDAGSPGRVHAEPAPLVDSASRAAPERSFIATSGAGVVSTARTAAPPAQPVGAQRATARLVVSPAFRVVEASPSCGDLLGVRADALVGQHVLDAIPDKAILDGVLKCLGKLPAAGEERMTIAPEGKPFRLAVVVARSAKDQPITITFAPHEGEAA